MPFFFWDYIQPVIEILILWFVFYHILVFFEGTRAFQVLKGITVLLVFFLVVQIFGLKILGWLLTKFFALSIIAIMIIFQQELRQGLARLGQQNIFNIGLEEKDIVAFIDHLTNAAFKLSRERIGALIAIERATRLTTYIESGVQLDAKVSGELINTIFQHNSPLHDGGIITRGDRIVAASCLFPLSDNQSFSKIIGTRHRAALGITEQTDALVIVVSEETGEISLASEGRFTPVVNKERLFNVLKTILVPSKDKKKKDDEKRPTDPQLAS